jgi:hypothetical protein
MIIEPCRNGPILIDEETLENNVIPSPQLNPTDTLVPESKDKRVYNETVWSSTKSICQVETKETKETKPSPPPLFNIVTYSEALVSNENRLKLAAINDDMKNSVVIPKYPLSKSKLACENQETETLPKKEPKEQEKKIPTEIPIQPVQEPSIITNRPGKSKFLIDMRPRSKILWRNVTNRINEPVSAVEKQKSYFSRIERQNSLVPLSTEYEDKEKILHPKSTPKLNPWTWTLTEKNKEKLSQCGGLCLGFVMVLFLFSFVTSLTDYPDIYFYGPALTIGKVIA